MKKTIYGAIALMTAFTVMFLASCEDHDWSTGDDELPLTTVMGGGLNSAGQPSAWRFNGEAINSPTDGITVSFDIPRIPAYNAQGLTNIVGAGFSASILVKVVDGIITEVTPTISVPQGGSGNETTFQSAAEAMAERIVGHNTWDLSLSANNNQARAVKYGVKRALTDIALGGIEKEGNVWRYSERPISGRATVSFVGHMNHGEYPDSQIHKVTVTLNNGVIQSVIGKGADWGCPRGGNGITGTGAANIGQSMGVLERRMVADNDWVVDLVAGATYSGIYLQSAVYHAIRDAARR